MHRRFLRWDQRLDQRPEFVTDQPRRRGRHPGPVQSQLCTAGPAVMAASCRRQAVGATAAPSTCVMSTRRLRRSERPGGRPVDATAQIRPRIAASLREHPSRSTARLTTLHGPWGDTGDDMHRYLGGGQSPRPTSATSAYRRTVPHSATCCVRWHSPVRVCLATSVAPAYRERRHPRR